MRHGRKSKTKRFDGYKEHIARDLDLPLVVACSVTPGNRPEEEGAAPIAEDIAAQGLTISELHIDRAYVNAPVVAQTLGAGGHVFAKPWGARTGTGLFTKRDFKLDLRAKTITCPAGEVETFEPGSTVEFDPEACGACLQRAKCTSAASGRGRSVSIAEDEALQKQFRRLQQTVPGRQTLRERVQVEHALAHIAARKGDTASLPRCPKECLRPAARCCHPESRSRSTIAGGLTGRYQMAFNPFGALASTPALASMNLTPLTVCASCGVIAAHESKCSHCNRVHEGHPLTIPPRDDGAVWVCAECTFRCRSCGFAVPLNHLDMDGAVLCVRCGIEQAFEVVRWRQALGHREEEERKRQRAAEAAAAEQEQKALAEENARKGRRILATVAVVVAIALGVVAVYVMASS